MPDHPSQVTSARLRPAATWSVTAVRAGGAQVQAGRLPGTRARNGSRLARQRARSARLAGTVERKAMSSGFMGPGDSGPGPFEEFMARFLGGGPRPGRRHIDIGRLMSDPARQLVADAPTPPNTAAPLWTPSICCVRRWPPSRPGLCWRGRAPTPTRWPRRSTGRAARDRRGPSCPSPPRSSAPCWTRMNWPVPTATPASAPPTRAPWNARSSG